MASQPQSYGSIREFLDNLPSQPCIWQPENANICVTCLRINEPVARVCSVWAQALEEAPLEEIDFEEEVRSLPSVVEVEDEFEMVESVPQAFEASTTVAEIDVVETSTDWDMPMEPAIVETTEPVAETAVAEPIAVEETQEVEAVIEASTDATEEIVEEAIEEPIAVEETQEVAEAAVAEPIAVEETQEVAEAVVAEPIATEVTLDTIQDAVEAENIAKENVESASEAEEITAEAVVEAVTIEAEAVEAYAEAVKDEAQAAKAVVDAVEAESVATEAVVEAAEQVEELVESEAEESEVQEAVAELKESVEKQVEAKEILTEAVTTEETAAEDVEITSVKEEEAADELEKAIQAEEETGNKLDKAIAQEEKAEEEVKETIEVAKEIEEKQEEKYDDTDEPFTLGEEVSHGVYGEGKVLSLNRAGKHWSVEVNFSEGKRRILGTFLTTKKIQSITEEPTDEAFKKPESKEKYDNTDEPFTLGEEVSHSVYGDGKVLSLNKAGKHWSVEVNFSEGKRKILGTSLTTKKGQNITEEPKNESFKKPESKEKEEIATVVADIVETDHGDYEPGINVVHDIFGTGKVIDSKPKGENYKLEIDFEDGTTRNLLSTFVKLSTENIEAIAVKAVDESAEEEAEAVVAEAIVEEPTVLDTDIIYKKPKKKKEPVIDLSKPEVQDAEMVDDKD